MATTKQVIMNEAIASTTYSYKPGDKVSLDPHMAEAWIASGRAKPAEDDPADLRKTILDLQERLKAVEPKTLSPEPRSKAV